MIGFDGVGSFLIMNDASTDDTRCILEVYAKQGVVVRVPQDFHLDDDSLDVRNQGAVFDACVEYLARTLNAHQMASTWLLTHDVDEFVWFNNSKTADNGGSSLKDAIRLLTKQHKHVQSLRIPRLLFGSSGHDFYEPGVPAIERYTYRFDADSCPSKERQTEQQRHDGRRLFNHQRPTSYCNANEKKLYDDHKSLTVMSAIARDCWDGSKKRVARCTDPHNHELKNPAGGPTKTNNKESAGVDPRYLDALDVLDTMAIMHYMTRSRQEFFQRTCGSQFAQKYFACRGCTPGTYFNLTETYANLLQDTRMHFMTQKLHEAMLAPNGKSIATSACNEMPPPVKSWDQYRKCWFDSE
jgi:Glycosyl transferase family 2